jgi:hypothetical protein
VATKSRTLSSICSCHRSTCARAENRCREGPDEIHTQKGPARLRRPEVSPCLRRVPLPYLSLDLLVRSAERRHALLAEEFPGRERGHLHRPEHRERMPLELIGSAAVLTAPSPIAGVISLEKLCPGPLGLGTALRTTISSLLPLAE